MHERFNKYFWDGGAASCSEAFRLRRIIEYASFPDLIHYPYPLFSRYVKTLELDTLRTTTPRRDLVKLLAQKADKATSWEEAFAMIIVHPASTGKPYQGPQNIETSKKAVEGA